MATGSQGFHGADRSDEGDGGGYVLSQVESDRLWRIFAPVAPELHEKAHRLLGRPLLERAGLELTDELIRTVQAMGDEVVQTACVTLFCQALTGRLFPHDPRRLADIPESDLAPYLAACRTQLLNNIPSNCTRILRALPPPIKRPHTNQPIPV